MELNVNITSKGKTFWEGVEQGDIYYAVFGGKYRVMLKLTENKAKILHDQTRYYKTGDTFDFHVSDSAPILVPKKVNIDIEI